MKFQSKKSQDRLKLHREWKFVYQVKISRIQIVSLIRLHLSIVFAFHFLFLGWSNAYIYNLGSWPKGVILTFRGRKRLKNEVEIWSNLSKISKSATNAQVEWKQECRSICRRKWNWCNFLPLFPIWTSNMDIGIFIAKYRQITPSFDSSSQIIFIILMINYDVIKLSN